MTSRVRTIAAVVGIAVLAAAVWLAAETFYLKEHRVLADERAELVRATAAFADASRGSRDTRVALRDLASTMLGRERTVVEHRLRGLLSELAERESLTGVVVSHGRPRVAQNPAGERGSGVARGFRRLLGDSQDFAVVDARLQGIGSLEQCLRTLAASRAQPWIHRVEGFSISPKGKDRAVYEVKIDLATLFAPDLVPEDAEAPTLHASSEADTALVSRLAARDPFTLVDPVVAAAPPPPPAPTPKPDPKPEPGPPYDKWRVVGVLQIAGGPGAADAVEVMLARIDTAESRTLKPGDAVLGATLESASGETAVFLLDGERVAVRTGETLAQARPAEEVHSARADRPDT